ncbi:MAG: replication and repair protein RecF [Parachlamydiales bacterium]|nr:replication and repair protein RecF [Parachlamydiales bacterium]
MFKTLYLRNFRNFTEASIAFGPKINVFCGANAQGKTNLLEAIALISTGRSFRTQHLSELIREGASFFFLEASIVRDNVAQTVRLSYDGQVKRVECNSSHYPSFQALLGLLPSVLYTPPDIDLITGSPSARRRFLNLHLAQSDPLYFHHLLRFWRAVKQRNSLLRSRSLDGIACWEHEMAASSAYLFDQRKKLIEELNDDLKTGCQALSGEKSSVQYIPSQTSQLPLASSYLAQLEKNRPREKMLGMTITGPHRDDFSITLDEKPARLFASDGQKRTAIAALRLSEWRRLERQIEAPPLFGVDDLELHLDRERQHLFQKALEALGQVFITTPEISPLWPSACRLRVSAGATAILE